MSSNDDRFDPYWMDETDWLVEVVTLPKNDPEHSSESLDYIGRLFAYAFATDTRMLAAVGDPEFLQYELWFSFDSDRQKQEFLQMVRDDGYADPDEEGCFDPPVNLEHLANLRPIGLVLPKEQSDHISALAVATLNSMGIEPNRVN